MAKTKSKELTPIAQAAKNAGGPLSAWDAVEAMAKTRLAATKAQEAGNSCAEFHFTSAGVQGVIKVGEVVLKIEG